MSRPRIKVCGMTSMQQVRELAGLGVDFAGFIFYEKSPRLATGKISADDLKAYADIQKVGVFVNEDAELIMSTVQDYGLNAVQLHGDETPDLCKVLAKHITVIKAFRVKGDEDLAALLAPYEDIVDYFLFDTKAKEYGGTGKQFDWSVLERTTITKPYFLSGGIGNNDIEQVNKLTATQPVFSLDVNSRLETEPGVKNMALVQQFVENIK